MKQVCRISEGNESLKTLRVLTENLPDFGDLILRHSSAESVETKTHAGTSMGFNLLYESKIAVAKWFGSKDSIFPEHTFHISHITCDPTTNILIKRRIKKHKAHISYTTYIPTTNILIKRRI